MYMPVLNKKQGELRALSKLPDTKLGNLKPLIIIEDGSEESLDNIIAKYSGQFVIDTRKLDGSNIEYMNNLIASDKKYSNISITFPISYVASNTVKNLKYISVGIDSIQEVFFKQWFKSNLKVLPKNIIIDVGLVDDQSAQLYRDDLLDFIDLIPENHNIYIISGAIPPIIPKKSSIDYVFDRFDLNLFDEIKANYNGNNNLIYGDYTVVTPILTNYDGKAIIPIVQIKYTEAKRYNFIRNGQRKGNYSLSEVAQKITELNGFSENHCWADKYIYDLAVSTDENRGNPSVWASLGIEHHIVMCIDEQN